MGTWGTALYSDDLAADLRGDFKDLIGNGQTAEQALDRLLDEYKESVLDADGTVFWLALADTAWRLGRPVPRATEEAIRIIKSGKDLERWSSPTERKKRSTVLLQLEERLRTDPPTPKRVPKPFVANNPWTVGEVLSFRLASGRLALFRVVGHHSDTGGRHAVCEILDWIGTELPSESDAQRLPVMAQRSPSGGTQFMCSEPRRQSDMDRFARTGWTSSASKLAQYGVLVFPYFDRQLRERFGLE